MIPRRDLDHVLAHVGDDWEALRGQRIFITGGTGFVGKWLVETLLYANEKLKLGIAVTVLTRDPERFTRAYPNWIALLQIVTLLKDAPESFDYPDGVFPLVIHASTENLEGTRRVVDFATKHGCNRFLFTSSGAVYGQGTQGYVSENYPPGLPLTDYGRSKLRSENEIYKGSISFPFTPLIARLFAFTGPYLPLDAHYAAGNFIRDAVRGGPVTVNGDGRAFRSYLYAADLAVWLWSILIRGEAARPYNVGGSEVVNIATLAATVVYIVGNTMRTYLKIMKEPVPGMAAEYYLPNVERARKELGLEQWISLEEGLKRHYAWALENAQSRESNPISPTLSAPTTAP